MSRGFFGVLAGIGILIGLGLVATHSGGFVAVENSTFSGANTVIKDLELTPTAGTHK